MYILPSNQSNGGGSRLILTYFNLIVLERACSSKMDEVGGVASCRGCVFSDMPVTLFLRVRQISQAWRLSFQYWRAPFWTILRDKMYPPNSTLPHTQDINPLRATNILNAIKK